MLPQGNGRTEVNRITLHRIRILHHRLIFSFFPSGPNLCRRARSKKNLGSGGRWYGGDPACWCHNTKRTTCLAQSGASLIMLHGFMFVRLCVRLYQSTLQFSSFSNSTRNIQQGSVKLPVRRMGCLPDLFLPTRNFGWLLAS